MTKEPDDFRIDLLLSHLELYARDIGRMEDFYTRCLGFVVTDRGAGPDALVFLSRDPREHHQLVLNPSGSGLAAKGSVDHVAFRVVSLGNLRAVHSALLGDASTDVETVSHGTTWSVYFRDPEGNRLEVFVDTPWYVPQPCRFPIDLALDDDDLREFTKSRIKSMTGFQPVEVWEKAHRLAVGRPYDSTVA